ncbi:MAG: phytoene/squalene synthase family protein [Halobacteriaceae archaeon]
MPQSSQVATSKAIHRRTGKTFYVATKFLPRRVRTATYALYGFFRVADEVVDDAGDASAAAQRERLAEIREAVLGETRPEDPVLAAFHETRREHDIPAAEVERFMDAMEQDVSTARYDTLAELEAYMRGSAVAVANMMTAVMDPEDEAMALPHARALGEAFQLTNFLRDVREDVVDRDRIYLPRETLDRHDATVSQIEALEPSPEFRAAMRDLLAHTEERYRHGVAGIKFLPPDCRFPVLLAAVLYADHHRLIRGLNCDTLSERPTLSTARKLSLVARTGYHWLRSRDPETVFHRVTAVDPATPRTLGAGSFDPMT